jgi:hypothetical protein
MATVKPDLTRVWANGAPPGNVVDPDTTTPGKVLSGWQAEVPPFEHFNFLQKWFTQGLAHFNEQGIAVWDTNTTYPQYGLAKGSDGEIYISQQEQNGNDPISDNGDNWGLLFLELTDISFIKRANRLSLAKLISWRPSSSLGGGYFKWNSSKLKSEHDGGNNISPTVPTPTDFSNQTQVDNFIQGSGETDPSGTGVWERITEEQVFVEDFGAIGDNTFDNTISYNSLISSVEEYSNIVFGTKGTYLGNFVSPDKSLNVDVNEATLVDTTDTNGIMVIGSFTVNEYDVTESELNNGDIQFTVVGASGLFSVGDIGYLWDQAVRPTGGNINYEMIKIAAIAGDLITVEGFLASYKGASGIKFYHSTTQMKRPSVKNAIVKPTDSHVSFGVACLNAEDVNVEKIKIEGFTGNAVSIRFCYDVNVSNIKPLKPINTGSGYGYGVALNVVSQFRVRDVIGLSCRHVYDQDSAYFGDIENISDMDDKSTPVTLAHNGFAGYFSCRNSRCKTSQYPITMSEQGYGGTPSADKSKHPFRNITIDGVDAVINESVSPNSSNICGVYIQNSVENVDIRNIRSKLLSPDSVSSGAGTTMIRVNGIARGYFNVNNVQVNKIGKLVFSSGTRDGLAYDGCISSFRNMKAESCDYAMQMQGLWSIDVDGISIEDKPLSSIMMYMQVIGSDSPQGAFVGEAISYNGFDVELISTTASGAIPGSLPKYSKNISSSIIVSAGQALTQAEIQERATLVRITTPIAAGTLTLSATDALPRPVVRDIDLYITQPNSGRQAVEFPTGDNIVGGFTINQEETVRLVSIAGKWQLFGRYSSS